MTDNGFPNTGTFINAGNRTNSGLSTQIIIKVYNSPVGALQNLSVAQNRPLYRIPEIGTDGIIEIVPNAATTYELTANRIVFDQLRLPESFSRGFRFIAAQRVPFDIDVIDISGTDPNAPDDDSNKVVSTYKNCWFTRYETPYAADNYIITESATIWCETAYLVQIGRDGSLRPVERQTDNAGIEADVNYGNRRGSLDAAGLVNSLFEGEEAVEYPST
jgi:hypothetical protein